MKRTSSILSEILVLEKEISFWNALKFWVKIASRILGPNLVLGDGSLWGREEVMADSISKAHVLNRLLPPAGY